MPSIVQEALALGEAALLVAAVAVPVGLACWQASRRLGEPVLPAGRGFSRWLNADVALLAFACIFLREAIAVATGPQIGSEVPEGERFRMHYGHSTVAALILAPIYLVAFQYWKRSFQKEPVRRDGRRFVAGIAAGVLGWVIVVPPTFAVHIAANAILDALAIPRNEHPLKHLKLDTPGERVLFLLGACAIAPIFEELGFRRIMVPWAARRPVRSGIVLVFAALVALPYAIVDSLSGPLVIVLVASALATAFVAKKKPRFPVGPAAAVLSTATLFAVVHSRVWPTPIPLFVLGLGLGWLVLRTKTATAAIVAHGLFNAISAVHMLRGGP